MSGLWRKTLPGFVLDFKGFAKGEEVAKVPRAVGEVTNNLNLGVGADDIEEHLGVLPEELTNWSCQNWDRKARLRKRQQEGKLPEERRRRTPQKIPRRAELLQTPISSLKCLETWTPTPKVLVNGETCSR